MYVGVIFYRFKPDTINDAVRDWEEMVVNEAKKQRGYIKADMFINERTGEAIDIGFWETEEDARRFKETGLFDLLTESLKDYILEPPRREQFKLVTTV
ncbi:MAG: antibiotic biosynthesis monooxygenase family protein [Thermoplasmatota archaeon]